MKYLCKVWKWLPVFYPFEANLRAAETTVSRRMCAGFNLQLSTLNPVSPCIHRTRWYIEIIMHLSPARHFFFFGISHSSPNPCILAIPWRPWVPIDHTISLKWRWKKTADSSDHRKNTADSSDHQVSLCRYAAQCRYGSMKTHPCAPFLRNWGGRKAPLRLKTSTCSSALHLSDSTQAAAHSVWNSVCARFCGKKLQRPVAHDPHSNRLDQS